jgi:hypothetical protein
MTKTLPMRQITHMNSECQGVDTKRICRLCNSSTLRPNQSTAAPHMLRQGSMYETTVCCSQPEHTLSLSLLLWAPAPPLSADATVSVARIKDKATITYSVVCNHKLRH